ncbi:Mitochondrial distribution and morphology protein 10 [Metarhizium rileyi]|uniref:Mitochondrial distribution and morphology protein 10 n=1 Tax=Metarhizium rileyi (strain RCEF 4871) TaxID=1649241 RepID=A0A5C6G3M6_METRR|nr:Mitochondrial distribution and morphology protein 10 [Metarhizium rileyi]
MREFMDYVHGAFYEATGWSRDNSYAALNATSDALLDFETPRGLRLTLSSLASANFATSYQLGSVGVVDGSLSYLFSSVPLRVHITPQSEKVSLPELLRSYRPLTPLSVRDERSSQARPDAAGPESSLFYGRLYLPQSQLEALVVRRLSPALQLQLSAVSAEYLRDGGTILGLAQYDVGKYAFEGLASSDGGLLGLRGIYNSGGDARPSPAREGGSHGEKERVYGRFSTGGEVYYGTLNKSGGISLGTRFATLPSHRGTPLSATLTMNPLMGNIAASYAVVAGKHCSLATRMEFNVYSYESAWAIGMELWRKPLRRSSVDGDGPWGKYKERSFQAKLEWRLDEEPEPEPTAAAPPAPEKVLTVDKGTRGDEYAGVLKARLDQNLRIGLLWEGRVKSLLFSLGSGIDLRKLDKPFRTLGLEIQFSS